VRPINNGLLQLAGADVRLGHRAEMAKRSEVKLRLALQDLSRAVVK